MKPITVGNVTLPLYHTTWKPKGKHRRYTSYVIAWRDGRRRRREKRSTLAAAKLRAEEIATQIGNGEIAMLELTAADRASYLRARDLLRPTGAALESVAAEFAACREILSRFTPHVSLAEACQAYLRAHPAGVEEKFSPAIVAEYVARNPACTKWARHRSLMLDRFAQAFPGPLTLLTPQDIDVWLDQLAVGLRTRRNYRDALSGLFTFARHRRYLPPDAEPLRGVSDPNPPLVEFELYQPAELSRLLAFAERTRSGQRLVPLICVTAFAGVRHGEMSEEKARLLDWQDFDWESKQIRIDRRTSKTDRTRTVDIPDNLAEWLAPYRRPDGPLCTLACSHDALCKLRRAAGITGKKRNALRKSFITYRLAAIKNVAAVAEEAGNSAQMIRQNYNQSATANRELAARWFAIRPVRADVLPLWQLADTQARL